MRDTPMANTHLDQNRERIALLQKALFEVDNGVDRNSLYREILRGLADAVGALKSEVDNVESTTDAISKRVLTDHITGELTDMYQQILQLPQLGVWDDPESVTSVLGVMVDLLASICVRLQAHGRAAMAALDSIRVLVQTTDSPVEAREAVLRRASEASSSITEQRLLGSSAVSADELVVRFNNMVDRAVRS
jgi:hypothetical protein